MLHGTEEQKAEHLPPMLRGEVAWCQGFSEPSSGSDMENAPRTSPVAMRGRWRCRCAGVPCCCSRYATMKWVLSTPDTLIQPRASSSTHSA